MIKWVIIIVNYKVVKYYEMKGIALYIVYESNYISVRDISDSI